MDTSKIQNLMDAFEAAKVIDGNEEAWSARDLMVLFEYTDWRNFDRVVKKAIENANQTGVDPHTNFVEANKISILGFGTRSLKDYRLTRGAAYLVAMNADTSHEPVAFAKIYFTVQTRKAEVIQQAMLDMDERIGARCKLVDTEKDLSETLWERGVDGRGIGIIRSEGDKALFGGLDTRAMKAKLGLPLKGKPLADKLHTVAIKAKELTAAMTSHNADSKDLKGQVPLQHEHVANNKNIRGALEASGIKPEDLPPGEDTAKELRRISRQRRALFPPQETLGEGEGHD